MSRIAPAKMAEIYYNRSRYRALADVKAIMEWHAKSPTTQAYWSEVSDAIQERVLMGPPGQFERVHENSLAHV